MTIEFDKYVRKPFIVEAVEITEANIEQLAPHIGKLVYKDPENKSGPYIEVDRKKIPGVFVVKPGYYFAKIGKARRCYSGKVFNEWFTDEANYDPKPLAVI